MFTPGVGADVPRVCPLEAFDESCGEGPTQVWIFAVRLLKRTIAKLIGVGEGMVKTWNKKKRKLCKKVELAERKTLGFGHSLRREHKVPHLCKIAKTRSFCQKEQRSTEGHEDMKKYKLTEDMVQDRKYTG